ncbi:MucR family transcriptional regulator [Methylobacterium nigriterrae]|uniref:MucR family transcriptional regulator n=1 Tax=Methylobacterium nigriterrae TaxID=3127512 RepID=UPI003013DC02
MAGEEGAPQSISAQQDNHIELAAEIVSAYISNNSVPISELPALIASVHATLAGMANGPASIEAEAEAEKATPAQIRKSITPNGLISFIDGKPYQILKRHLTSHGLDASSYRQRYGLPADYPMVAASYAAQRSELAKALGLGRLRGTAQRNAEQTVQKTPKTRGRPKKS